MRSPYNIKRLFKDLIRRESEEWLEKHPAWFGDTEGTVNAGNGMVYARLHNGNVITVLNRVAPARFDMPVIVGRSRTLPNVWQVIEVRNVFDEIPGEGEMEYHHEQHEEKGPDRLNLDRKQIMQLTVRVKSAFVVRLYGAVLRSSTGWTKVKTKDINLSSYVPTAGARFAAIETDDNGVASVNAGTVFAAPEIGTSADYPLPAAGKYTRAFVLLYEGQTSVLDKDITIPMPADVPGSVSGAVEFLDDLLDVNAPAPTDGQVLTYDFYAEEWIAADPTGEGSFDLAAEIHAAASGSPLDDDDEIGFWQAATGLLKKTTLFGIINHYTAYFSALFADISEGVTNGDSHDHSGGDGGIINHTTLSNIGTNTHAQIDTHIASTSNPHAVTAAQAAAIPIDGWQSVAQTWTYASADDPVYQIYVSGDVTANADYKLGNKIKCTNNSTTFYGWIVKVGAYDSGNNRTPVDVYGGSDYDIANSAITAPYISKVKSPDGFSLDRSKWDRETNTVDTPSKSSPTASVWYGGSGLTPTGPSLVVPIGHWELSYDVVGQVVVTTVAVSSIAMRATLSTANNSESDVDFSSTVSQALPIGTVSFRTNFTRSKNVLLTAKQTYYVNILSAAVTSISMNPTAIFSNIIRAKFLYL